MTSRKSTPEFTEDWFSNNIHRWEKYFKKLKEMPITALELGSFEGRSALWTIENILTHPLSHITCIDNFSHSEKAHANEIKKRFQSNMRPYKHKVTLIDASTRDALKSRALQSKTFDFVYIDAGRHAKNVLEDAILSFALLKEGGYIVFDDYTTSKKHDYTCPKKGIDAFLDIFSDEVKVIHTSWQVIAKKIHPLKTPKPCRSELFT
jgi:predicted O-methyltransferase YrrM